MGRMATWLIRLVLALVLIGTYAPVLAQDATPEASPVDVATPEAVGEATPVTEAVCTPGASITASEQRALEEERFAFEEPTNTEGTYITGATGDLESVNPYLVESDPSLTVVSWVFDGLLGGDSETGQPVPGGVTDYWELADDCMTYTFHLRTDKVWHDGVDLTADDVAFSFESLSDETLSSAYTGSFLDTVASWEVIDADTIKIVSNGPRADFLNNASFFIIPKHIWQDVPRDQWLTDPGSTGQDPARVVGTGPFKFTGWTQGQEITMVRNDLYTPRPAWIAGITIRIFQDAESQLNAFLTEEIDDISLEPEQVETVRSAGDQFVLHEQIPGRGFFYYEFNLNQDITTRFADPRVRQAFMYALDRQSIVDNILLGYGEVANGTQPTISYAYAPDQMNTIYGFDPERAKQLLAEAGWTDTNGNGIVDKDGVEMEFEFLYFSGSGVVDTLVAYMQDAWGQVGIGITPRSLEFGALIEATTTNLNWEMAFYGFSWDSTFFQDVMFACDMYQVGFNDMKYCNPELDVLGDQIAITLDQAERTALMIQYSNMVNDDQPVGIMWFDQGNSATHVRLRNIFPGPWGGLGIDYIWIDE